MNKVKEIETMIKNISFYDVENFKSDAKRYIKAIKEGRIIVNIASVSSSGMSRKFKFLECAKNKYTRNYQYLNFNVFLKALGYKVDQYGEFRVNGCGMDMVFATNYDIIHTLKRLGLITTKTCEKLAQQTPTTI